MANSDTIDTLSAIFEDAIHHLGYRYFYCGEPFNPAYARDDLFLLTNWPGDWHARYFERRYALVDPVVHYAARNPEPIDWSQIRGLPDLSRAARKVVAEARSFGIRSGLVVPFHSAHRFLGGVTLASEAERIGRADQNRAILISTYYNAISRKMAAVERRHAVSPSLTARERECLAFVAIGKSNWETSVILSLSERTVKFHVENAMKKLNVATRAQAAVEAVRLGEIHV